MIVTLDLNQKVVKQFEDKAKAEGRSREERLVDNMTEVAVTP